MQIRGGGVVGVVVRADSHVTASGGSDSGSGRIGIRTTRTARGGGPGLTVCKQLSSYSQSGLSRKVSCVR